MKSLRRILVCAVLLLSFVSFKGFAQAPEWEWARSAGGLGIDRGNSLAIDSEGNMYVTGYFGSDSITFGNHTLYNSGAGTSDIFIVKYDSKGIVIWAKSAGGSSDDYGEAIAIDNEGNVYVTGLFSSFEITFDYITLNGESMFIVKYDPDGNVLWAKSSESDWGDPAKSIVVDGTGNVYVAGWFSSSFVSFGTATLSNNGNTDIFIVKYDKNGAVLWAKSAGGTEDEIFPDIAADSQGNIYVTGAFSSASVTFGNFTLKNNSDEGLHDIFIAKYNSNGQVVWAKSTGGNSSESGFAVMTDKNNNIYLTGFFASSTINFGSQILDSYNSSDMFLAKYNSDGVVLWAKGFGGFYSDEGKSILADRNGDVYVLGNFVSSITFGDEFLNGESVGDIFVVKFDINGDLLWAKAVAGSGDDLAHDIAIAHSGEIYITGAFNSSILNFDNEALKVNKNEGAYDVFIAQLNSTTTSVAEKIYNTKINIFPYPTTSQFHITNLSPGNWTITIYTLDGQSVFKKEVTEADAMIDLSNKAKGAYVYRLLKDGEVFKTGKIVLE